MFNPKILKDDFPIFYHQPGLVYLDSASTSLKPISVITKLEEYYKQYSANVHRGIYELAEKATEEYEETRKITALFLHAKRPEEIVFTRGTTESINLVASALGPEILEEGDEIVTSIMEHHSNFVPWQHLATQTGALFKIIDVNRHFELAIIKEKIIDDHIEIDLGGVITKLTKILALGYISNALGTVNPIKEVIQAAKKINPSIITIVDAAQAVPHMKIDVQELGCDFLAFSSHKMLGPTGVGVLWGRYELLERMPPYQFGGEMIYKVALDKTTYKAPPYKFEAGTPPIAGVIALKAAIQYLEYLGFDAIRNHEMSLVELAEQELNAAFNSDITFYRSPHTKRRAGILTFTLKDLHPHDLAQILSEEKVCIRAGHHCTQPLHKHLDIAASARASFYIYNTEEDVHALVKGLQKAKNIFKK
ncbi:cysteine desulfurase SufS [soil metagenome]